MKGADRVVSGRAQRKVAFGSMPGWKAGRPQLGLRSGRNAGSHLRAEQLRLFPGGEMAAFVDLVEIDELVIGPLGPTPRRLIVLAGKDAHRSRDRDVGGVVKVDVTFPIEASRGNRRVRQPIEREVVEHVVAREVACGMSIDRAPEHGRGDRRRRLAITVAVVKQPGCQADGRIRQSVQRLGRVPIICA